MIRQSKADNMENREVIDQYHERIRGLVDRRLVLLEKVVTISGTVRGTPVEGNVPLELLPHTPHRMWLRSKHFHWALAVLLILTPFLFLPFVVSPPNYTLLCIGGALYLPAVWYSVRSSRRREMALFLNRSGIVALDFWRCGPDADRFPEFVRNVELQIRKQVI